MRSRLLGTALLLPGLLCGACSRTPPEPAPASTTSSPPVPTEKAGPARPATAASGSASLTGRCIASMPSAAPAIPAAASAPACPSDPEPSTKMPTAQVGFPEAPDKPKVDVEIAANDHDIQRGLMYRTQMGEERGMLFRLGERREHTFWMHNTCIPLDMLFVDDDGVIVGIVEGATPLTDTTRTVGCPSTYVLEVNAGFCRRHGVRPGQKMGIPQAAR